MRNGSLLSLVVLLVGAALSTAQQPSPVEKDPGEILQQTSLPADSPNAWDQPDPEICSYFWFSPEYLHWWMTKFPLSSPLLTTNPNNFQGVIGFQGTSVVYGGNNINLSERNGVRLSGGWNIESFHMFGIESSTVLFGDRRRSDVFQGDTTGAPVLSRPVINARSGNETIQNVSFPGQFTGTIQFDTRSQFLSTDLNTILRPFTGIYEYPEFIVGVRYQELQEQLDVHQQVGLLVNGIGVFNGQPISLYNRLNLNDSFNTHNRFVGANLGLRQQFDHSCFFLNFLAQVSIGSTHQELFIAGDSTVTSLVTGAKATLPGGVLALASNIGKHVNNEFTAIPELRLNCGWHITSWLQATVGYNFLYWGTVLRPGDQIDRRVNPGLLPTSLSYGTPGGPAQPTALNFTQSAVTLHGLNVGLAVRW